ncbi:CRISPR-associated endonuclease Cas2 [Candidatus Kaiserbacteria bacterium CG10_big_fil_rev_8_21_14_0_10_45_20]|uniref:CRISPR-associated endonuclease Cas2 n=1 Tax=Candidatus Kaiserbacteria bacterium CG10_big_fil_rev_8_21_14_0_10_45_20 TaxID=1974607 RepID=A0A2H0UEW6_9BACT|nr:MAG: CRISPR-associated endonuclease Cas2 [Candidatus Kaiserbacteria bacterium CG10_big_fil_rev_8_21_14_0_10_45_20]
MKKYWVGVLERDILEQLSGGDLLYGFLLSARSSRRLFIKARERASYRYRRKQAILRLKEKRFIQQKGELFKITPKGTAILKQQIQKTHNLLNTKRWDGRWRIVAFDVPEKHRSFRNKIRLALKEAGFIQMQKSVWVFPHECKELSDLLKEEPRLTHCVLYGVLEQIENEEKIKKIFNL